MKKLLLISAALFILSGCNINKNIEGPTSKRSVTYRFNTSMENVDLIVDYTTDSDIDDGWVRNTVVQKFPWNHTVKIDPSKKIEMKGRLRYRTEEGIKYQYASFDYGIKIGKNGYVVNEEIKTENFEKPLTTKNLQAISEFTAVFSK